MISRKELSYVSTWASKVPYPGKEYAQKVLEELTECLNIFNREYLNRVYNIIFSNNEEIEFQILERNICHMLGIEYKNISEPYFSVYRQRILKLPNENSFSSYDLINAIAENADSIVENDERRQDNKAINYYRVAVKCAIFKKMVELSTFNYGCINFNKESYNALYPNKTFGSQSTRLIYTPSDEIISPYFMMGLKSCNNDDRYFLETLFAPVNYENFFHNQEVVIPTQIITDNNGMLEKRQATSEEKIRLIREYQSIINSNDFRNCLNIYGDYLSMLMSQSKEESKLLLK